MPRYIPYMPVDSPERVAGSLELRKIKNQLNGDLKTLNLTIDPKSTPEERKKATKKLYFKYNKKRNKFSLNPDKDFEDLYIDPIILMQLHKELGELKDATNELLRKTMLNYANNSFLSPYYLQPQVNSNTLEGALGYFNVAKNATNEPFSTAAFMASPAFSSLLLGSLGYMASDKVAEDAGLTGTDKKITGIAGGATTGLLSYLTHGTFKNMREILKYIDEMKKGPIDVPYTELNSNLIKNTQKYLPTNSKTYFLVTGDRPLLLAPKTTTKTSKPKTIRLYRITGTNGMFLPSEAGGELYAGLWFTDDPTKPLRYGYETYKKGKKYKIHNPTELLYIDIPETEIEKYKASNIADSNLIEFEPEDYLIPLNYEKQIIPIPSSLYENMRPLDVLKFNVNDLINHKFNHIQGEEAIKMFKEYGGTKIPENSINGELLRMYVPEARERYGLVGNMDITDEEIAEALYKHSLELKGNTAAINAQGEPLLLFRGDTKSYTTLKPSRSPLLIAETGEATMDNALGTLFLGEFPGTYPDKSDAVGASRYLSGKYLTLLADWQHRPSATGYTFNPGSEVDGYRMFFNNNGRRGSFIGFVKDASTDEYPNDLNAFIVRTPSMRNATSEISVLDDVGLLLSRKSDGLTYKGKNYRFDPVTSSMVDINTGKSLGKITDGQESRLATADHYNTILKDAEANNLGLLKSERGTPAREEHKQYTYFALPNFNIRGAKHILPYDLRIPRDWNDPNIFRFTDRFGKEITPTPYYGSKEELQNSLVNGIIKGIKYRTSPLHMQLILETMGWTDDQMDRLSKEFKNLSSNMSIGVSSLEEGMSDIGAYHGKYIKDSNGNVVGFKSDIYGNIDRIPNDAIAMETGAHEMGGHGLTAGIRAEQSNPQDKYFPLIKELMLKNKELARLILVPINDNSWDDAYNYFTDDNELVTRVIADNALGGNTSGFEKLKEYFTPESLQEYKGEVLDTGVNTSRFYDPKDPELILTAIDAWNTRYPNSGLELLTPRDKMGYDNEKIRLIGSLPFSQKVKDTAELMKLRWERYNYDKSHLGTMIDGNYSWSTRGTDLFFDLLTNNGRASGVYLPYNRNSNTTGFYSDLDGQYLRLYPERPKPYDYTQFHEGISHPTDRIVEKMTTPVAGKKVLEPVARLFGGVKYSNSMYGRISYPMDIYPQEMIDKYLSSSALNPREARATNWEEIMKIYSEIAKKYNISYKDAITTKKDVFEKTIDNMSLSEFKNLLLRMDNAYIRDYVKLMNAGTEDLANLWLKRFKGALKYGPIVTGVIAGTAASNNRYGGKLMKRKLNN